jgi:cysteine desulfurase / selenocysteine lyase
MNQIKANNKLRDIRIKDKFTFFRNQHYIYLDSASTTQVPDLVIKAVTESLGYKGNPHRGAHQLAKRNGKFITDARENISQFIGAGTSEIIFTNNTTDSINLAVESIAHTFKKGDEILLSLSEHNSHILPFHNLSQKGVKIKCLRLKNGVVDIEDVATKLSKNTKLVAVSHCSNVLGTINPVEEIGSMLLAYNPEIIYSIDGAQAVAHLPIDVKKLNASFYSFSGHKMYGPDGIGVLYVNKKLHGILKPIRVGGGTVSQLAVSHEVDEDILYPGYYPTLQVMEGGTPNVANIIGLSKAVNFIKSIGFEKIREHDIQLTSAIIDGLKPYDDIEIIGGTDVENRIGVVSFSLKHTSVVELGDYLGQKDICIRYGAHCAFLLLNETKKETIRISLGIYNDFKDINECVRCIGTFLNTRKKFVINNDGERIKKIPYKLSESKIHSVENIVKSITNDLKNVTNPNVVVMGGHFLGIPDIKNNTFFPSIKKLVPMELHTLLQGYGMTEFPTATWEMSCKIVSRLKELNTTSKLIIVLNDITGINELLTSSSNTTGKTVENYRAELTKDFYQNLPHEYLIYLKKYNLSINDIIFYRKSPFFQESVLRNHFKNFVRKNKTALDGVVEYTLRDGKISLEFNILTNPDIKTCAVGSFGSKTGGKYCIATVGELLAELFGIRNKSQYKYIPENIQKPISNCVNNMFVMLSPAMCNNAVNSAAELYIKLFSHREKDGLFTFLNVPLGPLPKQSLRLGVDATLISNKIGGVAQSG